jgi:hypothetical protein
MTKTIGELYHGIEKLNGETDELRSDIRTLEGYNDATSKERINLKERQIASKEDQITEKERQITAEMRRTRGLLEVWSELLRGPLLLLHAGCLPIPTSAPTSTCTLSSSCPTPSISSASKSDSCNVEMHLRETQPRAAPSSNHFVLRQRTKERAVEGAGVFD